MSIRNDKLVMVCGQCFKAACWYREFMCDWSREAGLVVMTVGELKQLGQEHPDFWTATKFVEVYGEPHPVFSERRGSLEEVRERLQR